MSPGRELLETVMADTLEQFAFLFSETGEEDDILSRSDSYLQADIAFEGGGEKGLLRVAAPEELCREMAANILGLDDSEIPAEAAIDAIKELANVLVGSLTAQRFGTNVCCSLKTPSAHSVNSAQVKALAAAPGALLMNVEEKGVVAILDEYPLEGKG